MAAKARKLLFFCFLFALFSAALFSLSSFAMTSDGKIVVVLDPGHGGRDSGTGEGSREEAYYTLQVAQACKKALEENGNFKVYLTHDDSLGKDRTLSLMERGMIANEKNADLLISCHFDGNTNTSLSGLSAYISVIDRYAKKDLAKAILKQGSAATGLGLYSRGDEGVNAVRDYGDKLYYWSDSLNWSLPELPKTGPLRDYYGIIKWNAYFGIPAIIVEHGFLSNRSDRAIIEKAGTTEKLGRADAAAIIAYYTGHTHVFTASDRDFPSNCMMPGKDSERCSICGCRRNTTLRPEDSSAHIWLVSEKKAATCESDGYEEYTCEITRAMNVGKEGWCDNHTYRKVIPATGHSYRLTDSKEATHGQDGYRTFTCSACGKSFTEKQEGEPHRFIEAAKTVPTCEAAGEILYRCEICGSSYREQTSPALGHSFGEAVVTPATCEAAGESVRRCETCGKEQREAIPALGHDPLWVEETAGDCVTDAVASGSCTRCGKPLTEVRKKAAGHSPGERFTRPAGCLEDGAEGYVCTVCGEEVITAALPAVGHRPGEAVDVTKATCERAGVTLAVCTVCGEEIRSSVPPLGHAFGEPDADGRRICSRCGEIETILPAPPDDRPSEKPSPEDGAADSSSSGEAGGQNPAPQRPTVSKRQLLLALGILGGFFVLTALLIAVITYRRVHGIVRKMREEESAEEDAPAGAPAASGEAAAAASPEEAALKEAISVMDGASAAEALSAEAPAEEASANSSADDASAKETTPPAPRK